MSFRSDNPIAFDLTCHFFRCMGSNPAHKANTTVWGVQMKSVLESTALSPEEMTEFLTFATTENVSDKPQFNSVAYLAKAKDPMATFVKHSQNLLRLWQGNRRAAKAEARATVRLENIDPLPVDLVHWMMTGQGVNTPLNGWQSARQKLDSIRCSWYGKDYANYPDPNCEWQTLYNESPDKYKGMENQE